MKYISFLKTFHHNSKFSNLSTLGFTILVIFLYLIQLAWISFYFQEYTLLKRCHFQKVLPLRIAVSQWNRAFKGPMKIATLSIASKPAVVSLRSVGPELLYRTMVSGWGVVISFFYHWPKKANYYWCSFYSNTTTPLSCWCLLKLVIAHFLSSNDQDAMPSDLMHW